MNFPEVILESWHRSAQLARTENPRGDKLQASLHVNAEALIAIQAYRWKSGPPAYIPNFGDPKDGRVGTFGPLDVYRVTQWDFDDQPRALLRVAA